MGNWISVDSDWRQNTNSSGTTNLADSTVNLKLSQNEGVRIIDLYHTGSTGNSYTSAYLRLYDRDRGNNNFYSGDYDNVDVYSFSEQTPGTNATKNAGNTSHYVLAIHKTTDNYGSTPNLGVYYYSNKSGTTANYKYTTTRNTDTWVGYGIGGVGNGWSSKFYSITVTGSDKLIECLYEPPGYEEDRLQVQAGHQYIFRLHTYSELGYDGIIISSSPIQYAGQGNDIQSYVNNNSNIICYCSGVDAFQSVTFRSPYSGDVYIYFVASYSNNKPGTSQQTISSTTTTTTNGGYNYHPQYDYIDNVYEYGDVQVLHNGTFDVDIYFDKQGGSGGVEYDDDVDYGTPAEGTTSSYTVGIPTKSGYTFLGYYTTPSGGTQYYNSTGYMIRPCDFTSNPTLYAHWGNNITSNGNVYSTSRVYCTSEPKVCTVTDSLRSVQIIGSGGACTRGSVTYSKSSGDSRITLNTPYAYVQSGVLEGGYTIGILITSPSGSYVSNGTTYYYFSMTRTVNSTIYVNRVWDDELGQILPLDSNNQYDPMTQTSLLPASATTLYTTYWEGYFHVPTVKQHVHFSNGTTGYVSTMMMWNPYYGGTFDKIKEIIINVLELNNNGDSDSDAWNNISLTTRFSEDLGIGNNSVERSEILGEIQNEFGLNMSFWPGCNTVYDLVKIVQNGNGDYYEYAYSKSFSSMGTYVMDLGALEPISVSPAQIRYYVSNRVYNDIMNWIYDYVADEFGSSSSSVSYQDRLDDWGLAGYAYSTTTTTGWTTIGGGGHWTSTYQGGHVWTTTGSQQTPVYNQHYNQTKAGELVYFIEQDFDISSSNLSTVWPNFVYIFDVIVYVQQHLYEGAQRLSGEDPTPYALIVDKINRNPNVPTLTLTDANGNTLNSINIQRGGQIAVKVKATYPSGSVEADVDIVEPYNSPPADQEEDVIWSSPTGKISIIRN